MLALARKFFLSLFTFPLFTPALQIAGNVPLAEASETIEICESTSNRRSKKKRLVLNQNHIFQHTGMHGGVDAGSHVSLLRDDSPDLVHLVHSYSVDSQKSLATENIAQAICDAGGRVAILGSNCHSYDKNGFREIAVDGTVTRWVQNYLGFWGRSAASPSGYVLFAYDLAQKLRSSDSDVGNLIAKKFNTPVEHINLKMQGGSLVSLSDNTALVSRKILQDNKDLSLDQCRRELAKMGIEKVIWSPWLAAEGSGHVDLFLAAVNGKVVVSQILDEAIRFSESPDLARLAQDSLNRIADVLTSNRLEVLRLAMPVPSALNERMILPYYSQINWILVNPSTNPAAKKTVIVPTPMEERPDRVLNDMYNEMNSKVYEQLGVNVKNIPTTLPEWGGGFRCISSFAPRSLIFHALVSKSVDHA